MKHLLLCFLFISNVIFSQEQKNTTKFWGLKESIKQGLSAQKENKHERAIRDFKFVLKIADIEFKHTEDYADLLEGYAISSLALGKPKGLLKKYKKALHI